MERAPIYILAGGRGQRFGGDKSRALLEGEPLVLRQARLFARRATRVTAVAERVGKFEDLRLRTIADLVPGRGPLGGLEAALLDAAREFSAEHERSSAGSNVCYLDLPVADWLLLTSCDTLGLDPDWLDLLLAERAKPATVMPNGAGARQGGGSCPPLAIVFRAERLEPLFGLYHVNLLETVQRRLAEGQGALWRLIEAVPHTALPAPTGWERVRNVNSGQDLLDWQQGTGSPPAHPPGGAQ